MQQFKNMAVLPVFSPLNECLEFLTLSEALMNQLITVTEASELGSVPELKVINKADIPVFLLDGEELLGAKQNRIVNTSILLREHSETIIPVSCTEQGRWQYASREFHDSDLVLSSMIRGRKSASVSDSLTKHDRYESDQHVIWNCISSMSETEDVHSQTGAMKDVYEKRKHDLDEFLKTLTHNPQQQGLLVLINGKVAGLDIIPNEKAYKVLHPKLVKSYAMDAILLREKTGNGKKSDNAASFMDEIRACREEKHKSVGYGWDYRFHGKQVVGSNLEHQLEVIHASFFRVDESDQTGCISSYSRRRSYRV